MTKNPMVNALCALAYITLVATFMFYGTQHMADRADTIFAPIAMISLFTLSAAVMAYLFCYQPLQLYFENKKKQAVNLFLQTVGVFGGVTFLLLFLLFSGVL